MQIYSIRRQKDIMRLKLEDLGVQNQEEGD